MQMFSSNVTLRGDMPEGSDVIRAIWSYREKMFTNRKKARLCGNGKPLKPKKKMQHDTYTACTSMFGVRLNIAIAAYEGQKLYCADVINAYAQAGPFSKRTYLVIDRQIKEWWDAKFHTNIPVGSLLEILSSLQGHHESGPNWQRKCNKALDMLGYRSPLHEPCLYRRDRGLDDSGERLPDTLMSRQIDDMLFAVHSKDEFDIAVNELKLHMDIEGEKELATHYNGIEIEQRREYIGIKVAVYIEKLCDNHGWKNMNFSKSKPSAPLTEAMAKTIIASGKGPLLKSAEGLKLEEKKGFGYRVLLGELIFACVVCRLDIAYSLSLLARYAEYPLELHYDGIKGVAKYLRETKDKPIIYWRRVPSMDLPPGDFVPYDVTDDMDFTYPEDPYRLHADADSSHATDLETRRSTGGHVLFLFASAVLWLSKLQATCALSSTEAEFMQAVICGKGVKYGRHVLDGIERTQKGPSPI